jgi:hypothetical protein
MTHATCTPTTSFTTSAGNPLFDLSVSLRQRTAQLRKRKSLRRLLDHEDYVLDDMNIARGDLDWVLSLPLSVDASAELNRLSEERRKKRF